MTLAEFAGKQTTILRSYAAFGSPNEQERLRGMTAMFACGNSAEWCLKLAIRQTGQPRVQFAAAVVLHWLGDRQGMLTLTEALKWRLPSEPLLAGQLESAFIAIGSPASVSALLTVWNMLPDWGEHEAIRACICRVWAALKNPIVLPALAAGALVSPVRFEQTTPAFGEMAIPILQQLASSHDSSRRAMAVQTLRHIPGPNAFAVIAPLLRDCDPTVRALAPAALSRVGSPEATIAAIGSAVRDGYPSLDAIAALCQARPDGLGDTFTAMFEVWAPDRGDRLAVEIVLIALPHITANASYIRRALNALRAVLNKPLDPPVAVALIDSIESLARRSRQPEHDVTACLSDRLSDPNPMVRRHAAESLARLGDFFPLRAIDFLDDCKPQDTFISNLHAILRGSRDAGQAATQAVQHVSRWWTQITTESTEQITADHNGSNAVLADPRLPATIRRMLSRVIHGKFVAITAQDLEDKASFIVLLLRAVARLGMQDARAAWKEIVSVLHMPIDTSPSAGRYAETRWYETTAAASAETLIALYGSESFSLFLETLYSPRMEVVRTGITALGILGDSRAIPSLRSIAGTERHPFAAMAGQVISQIRRTNPEMMTLLRGSAPATSDPDMLLRAAHAGPDAEASGLLLRASAPQLER